MHELTCTIYQKLYDAYGPRGWWPEIVEGKSVYAREFTYILRPAHCFEICIGAILTQNTTWSNAARALINLKKTGSLTPGGICFDGLAQAIRPSGYYEQKAKKIQAFTRAWHTNRWEENTPARDELLNIWGIGPETADDMLLYAFGTPCSVVDKYALRLYERLGAGSMRYDELKAIVEDTFSTVADLREYHALIVEHAKRHCSVKPRCDGCVLGDICKYQNR
ncbi:MAG TPA: endonuclease [Clostridia bacterium]|nr:endonuclease [Clostridia bacterium]